MGAFDIVIILFILIGGLEGYKHGFTRSLVDCIGSIIVAILAFILKNPISNFMMLNLPFFDFFGLVKGASILNILIYEALAFILVFSFLMIALKLVMFTTSVFEKILSATIVLGLPSKILGAVVGMVKNYVLVFIALYIILLLGLSNNEFISSSKYKNSILSSTPVLSSFTDKSTIIIEDFAELKDKYKGDTSSNEFNLEAVDLFLKYDIVKVNTIDQLVKQNKLHIDNINEVLTKYKED